MNSKDLLKAIGDVDEKYLIEENNIQEDNRATPNSIISIIRSSKFKYVVASIFTIFIIFIGIHKSGIFIKEQDISNLGKNNWIIKEVKVDNNYIESINNPYQLKWDEMSISQQYTEVEYNNGKYMSKSIKIPSEKILKNISNNSVIIGYSMDYNTSKKSKNAKIYSIKGISEECAIAVKFDEDNSYYVYVNYLYRPNTLGELVKDLNLKENTFFGTIYYTYMDQTTQKVTEVEFYDVDNKVIWSKLFNDLNLENIYSDVDSGKYVSERLVQRIDIKVNIPLLGYDKLCNISLTDKGYLLTNILETGKGFFIGKEKIQEFLDYVIDNYDGYKIVYIYDEQQDMNEVNNTEEEKIIKMENNVNT